MIRELDTVALKKNLPQYGLKSGDVGAVVMVHEKQAGYEVEFVTLKGKTLAVVTLKPSDVRAISKREIAHARPVT
jgi:hypothetical protein